MVSALPHLLATLLTIAAQGDVEAAAPAPSEEDTAESLSSEEATPSPATSPSDEEPEASAPAAGETTPPPAPTPPPVAPPAPRSAIATAPSPEGPAPETRSDFATADWSVGAGAAFGNNLLASAVVERRLVSWLWVFAAGGAGGDFLPGNGTVNIAGQPPSETTTTSSSLSARLATGLRMQLVDDTAFARPSLVVGVAAGMNQLDFTSEGTRQGIENQEVTTSTTTASTTTNADLFGGAMVDFTLLPWLALRFSTDIVSVGLRTVERSTLATSPGEADVNLTSKSEGFAGRFLLAPAMAVQAFF